MSKTVIIDSSAQFSSLITSSRVVVTDFHAEWCGPCKQIAPAYEQLSARLSRPNQITFAKVDVDKQPEIARTYGVTAMPTFMIFKNAQVVETVKGADPRKLNDVVQKLAAEAESGGSSGFETSGSSSEGLWTGADLPKGYKDVTDQVDVRGLDLLNSDSDFGTARTLFLRTKPSGAANRKMLNGKGKSGASTEEKTPDWIESDTDEQLMLFIPFQSTLKVHTLHITSLPPTRNADDDNDDEEGCMRPKTINVYSNRAHVLGFEEAEGIPATQTITLSPRDWDEKTGTAKLELRFVKFQNVTSLVVFVVDGEGDGEKVRLDRLRVVGETGEKRDGKIEKISDESG